MAAASCVPHGAMRDSTTGGEMGNVARMTAHVGILLAALSVPAAYGQISGPAGASYSRGVGAYFSGNATEAEQYLSQAIQELPDDPRPYYFRALALLRAGRRDEALSDMQVGAALEARRPKQFAVGTALERVQGSDRLLLEQYRRQGRTAATIDRDDPARQHYDLTVEPDSAVLRRPAANARPPALPPSATTASGNPFADDTPKPPLPTQSQSDPFATDKHATSAANPEGNPAAGDKRSSGKLMGVLGRVLSRTVPLPSVEGLRNKLPQSSSTPDNHGAKGPPSDSNRNTGPNAANNSEDPFGGP